MERIDSINLAQRCCNPPSLWNTDSTAGRPWRSQLRSSKRWDELCHLVLPRAGEISHSYWIPWLDWYYQLSQLCEPSVFPARTFLPRPH